MYSPLNHQFVRAIQRPPDHHPPRHVIGRAPRRRFRPRAAIGAAVGFLVYGAAATAQGTAINVNPVAGGGAGTGSSAYPLSALGKAFSAGALREHR